MNTCDVIEPENSISSRVCAVVGKSLPLTVLVSGRSMWGARVDVLSVCSLCREHACTCWCMCYATSRGSESRWCLYHFPPNWTGVPSDRATMWVRRIPKPGTSASSPSTDPILKFYFILLWVCPWHVWGHTATALAWRSEINLLGQCSPSTFLWASRIKLRPASRCSKHLDPGSHRSSPLDLILWGSLLRSLDLSHCVDCVERWSATPWELSALTYPPTVTGVQCHPGIYVVRGYELRPCICAVLGHLHNPSIFIIKPNMWANTGNTSKRYKVCNALWEEITWLSYRQPVESGLSP